MRVPRDWRDDTGSTLPLVLFYAALAIGLILVVVAASSLYLERKQLFTLADGAALVGAESFDLDDVSVTAEGALRPTLRADEVAQQPWWLGGDRPQRAPNAAYSYCAS